MKYDLLQIRIYCHMLHIAQPADSYTTLIMTECGKDFLLCEISPQKSAGLLPDPYLLLLLRGGNQDIIFLQSLGDLGKRRSIGGHSEDPLHHCGGLVIHKKRFVLGHLIAIGNRAAAPDAMLHAVAENCLDLLTGILGVPLIHDIQEWGRFVLGRAVAVHIIVDRDEADSFVREQDLGIEAHLHIEWHHLY